MTRFILLLFFFAILTSCNKEQINNDSNVEVDTDVITNVESTEEKISNEIPAEIEEKILSTIRSLPEVEEVSKYMKSASDQKKGMAYIIQPPEEGSQDFHIRAGLNGEYRFETYYHFYINTSDYKVKIYDVIEADVVDMDEWRKREKGRE